MSRTRAGSIRSYLNAKFGGISRNINDLPVACVNDFAERWRSASADTDDIEVLRVDADDDILLGRQRFKPLRQTLRFRVSPSAKVLDQIFFIVPWKMRVEKIEMIYGTANGAAFTATVKKVPDGVALAQGEALHAAVDLNSTANTVYTATLSTVPGALNLNYKDRLGISFSGTLTSCAGVLVQITVSPGGKGDFAVFYRRANTELTDQAFHLALFPQKIQSILYAHATAGTDAGTVTAHVEKDTGTTAPGSGTAVQTGTFNCKATANTVQVGTVDAAANRLLPGNRLSVDFTGTLTSLAGVVIVVVFDADHSPADRVVVTYKEQLNADMADAHFFIADRAYEIVDAMAVWTTAAGAGNNCNLTKDVDTDAAGAGANLLSNDGNAGFQIDGTANTPERASWISTQENFLLPGDRLSVDFTATTSLVGMLVTVALKPV